MITSNTVWKSVRVKVQQQRTLLLNTTKARFLKGFTEILLLKIFIERLNHHVIQLFYFPTCRKLLTILFKSLVLLRKGAKYIQHVRACPNNWPLQHGSFFCCDWSPFCGVNCTLCFRLCPWVLKSEGMHHRNLITISDIFLWCFKNFKYKKTHSWHCHNVRVTATEKHRIIIELIPCKLA